MTKAFSNLAISDSHYLDKEFSVTISLTESDTSKDTPVIVKTQTKDEK